VSSRGHIPRVSRVYFQDTLRGRNVTWIRRNGSPGNSRTIDRTSVAVAYRMLGSLSEADDAVQDAWLQLSRANTSEVENLRAWLTTIVAHVALNTLRSRRSHRTSPLVGCPETTSYSIRVPATRSLAVGITISTVLERQNSSPFTGKATPRRVALLALHDKVAKGRSETNRRQSPQAVWISLGREL
jgi:hypothetical protein